MNGNLATIIVLLMCMLNFIPPLFATNGLYFDNVYYSLLYLLLSFVAISLPFMITTLNKHVSKISFMIGGWFIFGLIFELINFFVPSIILNNSTNSFLFSKFLIVFTIGLAFTITHKQWRQTK